MRDIAAEIQERNVHNAAFVKQKRVHLWAAFSGRVMIWASIRGTRREVRALFDKEHYDIRRVTVIEGKW